MEVINLISSDDESADCPVSPPPVNVAELCEPDLDDKFQIFKSQLLDFQRSLDTRSMDPLLHILHVYLANLVNEPLNPKFVPLCSALVRPLRYSDISLENPQLVQRVLRHDGAIPQLLVLTCTPGKSLLLLLGFRETEGDDGPRLVLEGPDSEFLEKCDRFVIWLRQDLAG